MSFLWNLAMLFSLGSLLFWWVPSTHCLFDPCTDASWPKHIHMQWPIVKQCLHPGHLTVCAGGSFAFCWLHLLVYFSPQLAFTMVCFLCCSSGSVPFSYLQPPAHVSGLFSNGAWGLHGCFWLLTLPLSDVAEFVVFVIVCCFVSCHLNINFSCCRYCMACVAGRMNPTLLQ